MSGDGDWRRTDSQTGPELWPVRAPRWTCPWRFRPGRRTGWWSQTCGGTCCSISRFCERKRSFTLPRALPPREMKLSQLRRSQALLDQGRNVQAALDLADLIEVGSGAGMRRHEEPAAVLVRFDGRLEGPERLR